MAAITLEQLLMAPVVTRAISRIKVPGDRLQRFFGFSPGMPNVQRVSGHHTGWDIFDHTRDLALGRPPGTGPATVAKQPIGHVSATIYRSHEKVPLLQERLFRLRPLGAQWGQIDQTGMQYLAKQQYILAQRFRNTREFMVSRMLRGQFQLKQVGENWTLVDSGGHITVDFKIPPGNKGQLDMLGTGPIIDVSWANPAADVIKHCLLIQQAFEQLHGWPLQHVWITSSLLHKLMNNTSLINAAGQANTPWLSWERSGYVGPDGVRDGGHEVVFRGLPWLRFHAYDAVLRVDGQTKRVLEDNAAIFLPDPVPEIFEVHEGSEIVVENFNDPGEERFGMAAWSQRTVQPAGWELLMVDNFIPVLYVPSAVAYATVVF